MRKWLYIMLFVMLLAAGGYAVQIALQEPESDTTDDILIDDAEISYQQREQWILSTATDCNVTFSIMLDKLTLLPDALQPARKSRWAMNQVMAGQLSQERVTENAELASTDASSRVAAGLAGLDNNRVWLNNWEINWQEGRVYAATETTQISGELILESKPDHTDAYTIPGTLEGNYIFAEDSTSFTCAIILTYQVEDTAQNLP